MHASPKPEGGAAPAGDSELAPLLYALWFIVHGRVGQTAAPGPGG